MNLCIVLAATITARVMQDVAADSKYQNQIMHCQIVSLSSTSRLRPTRVTAGKNDPSRTQGGEERRSGWQHPPLHPEL